MPKFYKKADDPAVLAAIQTILSARPIYGYKRITAMINRERKDLGQKRLNKKRILRVMQMNGLMLPKAEKTRTHQPTGKVMTLHSNTRWCSDCFEIRCYNREKVFVAFALDTCDREVIRYIAKTEPILAVDIQALMLMSVEARFDGLNVPRKIQWLSDRGLVYRAEETRAVARQLNLEPCYTMAYSPESNGMAEALVHTIKRDYVYVNDCVDPATVLSMLPLWFADYNRVAPHSSLGMLSPVEYRSNIS